MNKITNSFRIMMFLVFSIIISPTVFSQTVFINNDSSGVTQSEWKDQITLSYKFAQGITSVNFTIYVDADNNQMLDNNDIQAGPSFDLVDGSAMDSESNPGIFTIYFDKDNPLDFPLQNIVNTPMLLNFDDGTNKDTVSHIVNPIAGYTLSGTVTNPANTPGLVVMAEYRPEDNPNKDVPDEDFEVITLTGPTGSYSMSVPDDQARTIRIATGDFLQVLQTAYVPPVPYEMEITSNQTALDFAYTEATEFISGNVMEYQGDPLENVDIYAELRSTPDKSTEQEGLEVNGRTDQNGDYTVGVVPGVWQVGVSGDYARQNGYMEPRNHDSVEVTTGTVSNIDFVLYPADDSITGTVTMDSNPFQNIRVYAYNDTTGYSWTYTNANGEFSLNVTGNHYYNVSIEWDMIPGGHVVEPNSHYLMAGSSNADFEIVEEKFPAKIYGTITNENGPIENAEVEIWPADVNKENPMDNGNNYMTAYTDANGRYMLMVDPGEYFLMSRAYKNMPTYYDENSGTGRMDSAKVVVLASNDSLDGFDIELKLGSALYGNVKYDTGEPYNHPYAYVVVMDSAFFTDEFLYGNGDKDNGMMTYWEAPVDSMGNYSIDFVPPGKHYIFLDGWEDLYFYPSNSNDPTTAMLVDFPKDQDTYAGFQIFKLSPEPYLEWATDVPNDQGLQVELRIRASEWDITLETDDPRKNSTDDGISYFPVANYSVWRGEPEYHLLKTTVPSAEEYFAGEPEMENGDQFHKDDFIWTYIDRIEPAGLDKFNYIAPTLHDSTGNMFMEYGFMVVGKGILASGVIYSNIKMGYSVDNIHPMTPSNVISEMVGETSMKMSWENEEDVDFEYYSVYKGSSPDFTPSQDNLVLQTEEKWFIDNDIVIGNTYHYVIASVDDAMNHSFTPVNTVSITSTGTEQGLIPEDFELSQNFPNPFNPSTILKFGLPEASEVHLVVYDMLGREVAVLVNGKEMNAGYHEVTFNASQLASGVYFYRINAGDFSQIKKMLLMK